MSSSICSRVTLFAAGILLGIILTSATFEAILTNNIGNGEGFGGFTLRATRSTLLKNETNVETNKTFTTATTEQNYSSPVTSALVKKWDPRDFVHKGDANLGRFGVGSHSQVGQDETVMRILDNKRGGYFVDLAANDAVELSNTLALETRLGWTGLCIEPDPKYHKGFRDRRCTLVTAVAGKKDGEVVKFQFREGGFGGIVGFDNTESSVTAAFHTVSLETIFDSLNVPSVVDYFSLDIEGAELYVMEKFPFHRYKFQVITVERPRRLRVLLEQHEYVYVMDHGWFGDELYIHKSIPKFDQVMRQFGTKPKPLSKSLSDKPYD
jgi:hypothetical protein